MGIPYFEHASRPLQIPFATFLQSSKHIFSYALSSFTVTFAEAASTRLMIATIYRHNLEKQSRNNECTGRDGGWKGGQEQDHEQ